MNLFLKYFLPLSSDGSVHRVYRKTVLGGPNSGCELLCYVTLESEVVSTDLNHVANFVWSAVGDSFVEYQGSALQGVKKSLRNGVQKAQEVLRNNKEIVDKGVDFEVTICVVNKGNLYISYLGNHIVTIFREAEIHPISELLAEHKVTAGSIALYPTDVVAITDDRHEHSWSNPYLLLEELQKDESDGTLENGILLFSQTTDFDSYLSVGEQFENDGIQEVKADIDSNTYTNEGFVESEVNPNEGSVESEKSATDLSNAEASEASDEYFDETLSDQKVLDNHVGVIESSPDEIDPKLKVETDSSEEADDRSVEIDAEKAPQTFLEKLKAFMSLVKEKIAGSVPYFKKFFSVISSGFSSLINGISNIISKIQTFIFSWLEKKYGKELWYKRMVAKASQGEFGRHTNLGKIEVGGYHKKDLQTKRIAIAFVAILVVILIFVGIDASKKAREVKLLHDNYITLENSVVDKLVLAETRINSDRESAEIALFEAQKILEKTGLDVELLSEKDKNALKLLKSRILTLEDKLYKRVAISKDDKMSIFLDSRLDLGEKSNPTDIAIFKDQQQTEYIYITDNGNNKLYFASTNGRFTAVEDSGNILTDPIFVDAGYYGVYVYDSKVGGVRARYGNSNGVPGSLEIITGLEPSDFGIEKPTAMGVFTAADNFYLLDSSSTSIMKVNNNEGKFGFPFTYLVDDSLTLGKDILADFIIYTVGGGSSGLSAYQYSSGEGRVLNSGWQIAGLQKPFEDLVAGYTGPTLDYHLFVFDQSQKRLLVFEKPSDQEGRHPGQLLLLREFVYRGDDSKVLSNVKDIVVDNAQQNAYILDGKVVWKISLQGL
jgi:hypothetical protein